jgi:lysophospholipase L1-like esterase
MLQDVLVRYVVNGNFRAFTPQWFTVAWHWYMSCAVVITLYSFQGLNMNKLLLVLYCVVSFSAFAEKPVLIIGASYANASTPINDNLDAPLGGIAVGLGDFLSLGNALVRNRKLSGHVINEAQAGATTLDRIACNPVCVQGVEWQGYDKQLTKALSRVSFGVPAIINADYVIISFANDCLHSDAFGIEQGDTAPCEIAEINALADRYIALGQRILGLGLTPVFIKAPTYEQLDLQLFAQLAGLLWATDKSHYDELTSVVQSRIENELPDAVQLNAWKKFAHLGDGIHPNRKSTVRAAKHIAKFVRKQENQAD